MEKWLLYIGLTVLFSSCHPFSEKQANAILLSREAKDNTIQNIANDALIVEAKKYFIATITQQDSLLYHREISICNNIGLNYIADNVDSCLFYYNKALQLAQIHQDTALLSVIYGNLIVYDHKAGDFINANNLLQERNRNNQLLIERQYALLGISGLAIILIGVFFYCYWKFSKQKTHLLRAEKDSLESQRQMQALKSMVQQFDTSKKSLRNEVLAHFDIVKKVALLKEDDQLNDRSKYKRSPLERINDIIYGKQKEYDWDLFFEAAGNSVLYKGMIRLVDRYRSQLNKQDRQICYLTCMDFNNSEIATLLSAALSTVEHRKTQIRKKLNIPDRINIKNYFLNLPEID